MPIYEYRCEQGHNFEVMQRMSDDPVVSCETCAAPVERVFHPVAVHFKGSGFYNTDYGTRKRSREIKEAGEGSGKYAKDDSSKSNSDSKGSDSNSSDSKSSDTKSSTKTKAASSSSD
jgi:putative FmdB family regulatory protein